MKHSAKVDGDLTLISVLVLPKLAKCPFQLGFSFSQNYAILQILNLHLQASVRICGIFQLYV